MHRVFQPVLFAGLLAACSGFSVAEFTPRPADNVPLAHQSLILDIVRAGERFVAVGERGHVVYSRDGRNWQQAESVPVSATLTSVTFAGGSLWAVGHDATIIHSRDLGNTWNLQHFEPEWERPLLDVHFYNARQGLAVGAYGLLMRTNDAGDNWETIDIGDVVTSEAIDWEEAAQAELEFGADAEDDYVDELDDDLYDSATDFDRGCYEFMECHLNSLLIASNGDLMIAAERGYGYRSRDGGETWESFRFPYPGSMFGLLPVHDGVLAFGLRGNVQHSTNFGDDWEMLESPIETTLMGGAVGPNGQPAMVGAGSTVLSYHTGTRQFSVSEDRLGSDYAAILFTDGGEMILAGEEGLNHE